MTTDPVAPDAAIADAPQKGSLKARVLGAGLWSAGGAGVSHVLRLASNLVVTRLLVPDMFGVMAVALTVSVILGLMSDVGLHQSVVRHPRGEERTFLDTVWSVQVVRGFVLWAVSALVGLGLWLANVQGWVPPDSAYAAAALPWVLAIGGMSSAIQGFHSCKTHLAVRRLEVRRTVTLEFTQQVVTLSAMILLAWLTRSIWAIVAANVLGTLVHAVLSYGLLPGPGHRWLWDKGALADLLHFGKWLLVSSSIGIWAMNADRLFLAGYADATYMGLYSVALGLAGALTLVFEKLFGNVMLPVFSEMARQEPQSLPRVYFRARMRFDPLALGASGFLFAAGPLVIGILYDARYREAGDILSILALALLVSRLQLAHQVYLALNQPKYHAMLNAVRVVSTFVLIPLGLWWGGLTGGLIAIALRELPTVPLTFWLNARHGLNRFRLELGLLVFWVAGYALGRGANEIGARLGIAVA